MKNLTAVSIAGCLLLAAGCRAARPEFPAHWQTIRTEQGNFITVHYDEIELIPHCQATVVRKYPCQTWLETSDGQLFVITIQTAAPGEPAFASALQLGETYTFPDAYSEFLERLDESPGEGSESLNPSPERTPAAASQSDAKTAPAQMPEELSGFYEDLNFAACYSTPDERMRIGLARAAGIVRDLPRRLRTVDRCLLAVERRIRRLDPDMIIGEPEQGPVVPAELIEVIGVTRRGDSLAVDAKVWPLSPASNIQLVDRYEGREGSNAAMRDAMRGVLGSPPRLEMHSWRLINGRWMRNEVNAVLIEK